MKSWWRAKRVALVIVIIMMIEGKEVRRMWFWVVKSYMLGIYVQPW
jgi:hypothetical protein